MTAQISPFYALNSQAIKHRKRVDFCLVIKPIKKTLTAHGISGLIQTSSTGSINHTEFTPLRPCPISVSIETKLTEEEWQTAMEQQAVWLAAHWNRLDSLIENLNAARDELCFLPVIIMQVMTGHS
ncbi:hypothetical protein FOMG_19718 [Fusarium oxysporum f. sp. melonis 26406]|uniref:PD-(D/E)XK nuclease-like domain-containing protein n=1 Tax=Fusarium oxysporum f. sp. melonis 26406 TaxID=1089452 RepID=W9YWI6_FUSOX|nr:hypothetical protein FOMG_19718 [Fusarium oxysporum f. sp. melonis 26406]